MPEMIAVQELLFDLSVQASESIDFGIDEQSLSSGRTPMPPKGVRFNSDFQGEFTGPKLKGRMVGTNYLFVRADGVQILNIQAVLATVEGNRIAVHATGTLTEPAYQASPICQLRLNLSFHTAVPKYSWMNRIQGWGTGTYDQSTRKAVVKVFAA